MTILPQPKDLIHGFGTIHVHREYLLAEAGQTASMLVVPFVTQQDGMHVKMV
jgi:hypothetical protein